MTVSVTQEFSNDGDGKTIRVVYKCKQSSPWTQFFTENNKTYNIREHNNYFTWAEFFQMMFMCGGRFLSVESLENVFTQSLFGKNLCRNQPFDRNSEGSLSAEDPRPVKDQCLQNLTAY